MGIEFMVMLYGKKIFHLVSLFLVTPCILLIVFLFLTLLRKRLLLSWWINPKQKSLYQALSKVVGQDSHDTTVE